MKLPANFADGAASDPGTIGVGLESQVPLDFTCSTYLFIYLIQYSKNDAKAQNTQFLRIASQQASH